MYFSFSQTGAKQSKPTVKDFDNAQSGHGGTMVSNNSGNNSTNTRIDWVKDVGTNETAIIEQLNKLRARSNV